MKTAVHDMNTVFKPNLCNNTYPYNESGTFCSTEASMVLLWWLKSTSASTTTATTAVDKRSCIVSIPDPCAA